MTTDCVGGVWNYSLALAEGLASLGCDCVIATVGPSPSKAQMQHAGLAKLELVETGLPLDWTAKSPDTVSATATRLAELSKRYEADSIHIHTPSFAKSQWDAPVVAVAHSCMPTWWTKVRGSPMNQDYAWRKQVLLEGMHAANCVIAPSRSFGCDLTDVYGPIKSLKVVYNGARLPDRCSRARQHYALCAGRIWDSGKNFEVLDSAASELHFDLCAAGPLEAMDGSSIKLEHLNYLGNLSSSALRVHYEKAGVFVSSSRYEPFGLAVLEAASYGMPLLLSDIPTFRELWDGAALFVQEQTPLAWSQALEGLMHSPDRRLELGAKARSRAASYTIEKMVDATYAIHRSLSPTIATAA